MPAEVQTTAPDIDPVAGLPAYIRPAVSTIETQQILAVSQLALGDKSVIPLWYGESDVPTPAFICAVAQRAQTVERGRREVVGRGVGGRRDARARGVGERHRAMGADDARCAETRPENLSGKSDDELRRGSRTA